MGDTNFNNDLEPERASVTPHSRNNEVITVVLTAENHLGYIGSGQHPRKRDERQQRLRHAFQQATDFAIVQGVDFFFQAGDLFDSLTPDERDRSFVASRLAQLKQAGVRTFSVGGLHDAPAASQSGRGEEVPSPQMSYASLGALHYFPPTQKNEEQQIEPAIVDVRGTLVGICGLGVQADQDGDPIADMRVSLEIERAAISLLLLHAPIEVLATEVAATDTHACVARASIEKQNIFSTILAGYHHKHTQLHIGKTDLVVAGATQHIDFSALDQTPGFVFLGLDAEGVRWCNHISVDALSMQRLVIQTADLWPEEATSTPTELILERLRPLCNADAMIQVRLEGELARSAYHQLDLNQIRRHGEEHCFALAIDDSALVVTSDGEDLATEVGRRFSLREELSLLADEWIAGAKDEYEQQALQLTKEELLVALDEIN